MIRGNDIPRAVGISTDSELFAVEVQQPKEINMSALHAAVCRNDHQSIRQLYFAIKDVNKIDRLVCYDNNFMYFCITHCINFLRVIAQTIRFRTNP